MLALGLVIALFAFWSVLGYAVLRAVRAPMDPLQELLISPVVGVVVTTLFLFLINSAGLPVVRFAYPLGVGLFVVAAVPLLVMRPTLPWRAWSPFGLVLLGGLLAVGWPLVQYGFDWLSLCNDDMANYCLGAARFLHNGFFTVPDSGQLIRGSDYSQYYWFLHVPAMVRPGTELVLAWTTALAQRPAHEVFMPTVLAFHLCQISALGALVAQTPALRGPAAWACGLLGVSALMTFGTLYQLIAQVIGIALLIVLVVVLMRPLTEPTRRGLVRRGVLAGVLGAGLFLIYPEVIPILGVAWLAFLGLEIAQGRVSLKSFLFFLLPSLLVSILLVRRLAVGIVHFLLFQANHGTGGKQDGGVGEFFPFYRLPSGIADFWGFFPLALVPPEPWASLLIAWGAVLLLAAVVAAAWMGLRRQPVAVVACVMLALTAFLMARGAYFGLYKIAMFLQPFVLGTMALAAYALLKNRRARIAALLVLGLQGMWVQQQYVRDSRGTGAGGGFPEIADPSRSRINADFRAVLEANAAAAAAGGIVCDSSNVVLAKFQAYYARGHDTAFPGASVGSPIQYFTREGNRDTAATLVSAMRLRDDVRTYLHDLAFELAEPVNGVRANEFQYQALGPLSRGPAAPGGGPPAPEALLIAAGPKQSILNRWPAQVRFGPGAETANFVTKPVSRARDHLIFIESELGKSYFLGTHDVSMYQIEPDPTFYRTETMAGIGRRFMFQVLNPTPGARMVMELSWSFAADAQNKLPPDAAVLGAPGATKGAFEFVGRGSGRIFSPPVEPQVIDGRSFVMVDMGRETVPFRQPRRGLMTLWGMDVSLDRRRLVCFARNISAVSAARYAALQAPSAISNFPVDLQNRQLEYSGIYEDGWASEHLWCAFAQPWNASEIVLRGSVPELGDDAFKTEAMLLLDGRELARREVGLKEFELRAPIPAGLSPAGARRKVEVRFSKLQNLPGNDRRPMACKLTYLGFESAPAAPVKVERFPQDLRDNPLLAAEGFDMDGWVARRASMQLTHAPGTDYFTVRGMVPNISDPNFTTDLRVLVDGQAVGGPSLKVGEFELAAPVPAKSAPGARKIELEFSAAQTLPGADGRTVAARLSFVGFTPAPLPPAQLQAFPQDLRRPLVQPVGVFDDGWLGETASFSLGQPADADRLSIEGMVPRIGDAGEFTTDVVVFLDGTEVSRRTVGVGSFEVRVPVTVSPVAGAPSARRVHVRFSAVQTLPPPDGRAVGARLTAVKFLSADE